MNTDTDTDTPTDYGTVLRRHPLETTPFEKDIIKAFDNPEQTLKEAMDEGKDIRAQKNEDKKDDIKYLLASAKRATESKKEQEVAKKLQSKAEKRQRYTDNMIAARLDASKRAKLTKGGKTKKSKRTRNRTKNKRNKNRKSRNKRR